MAGGHQNLGIGGAQVIAGRMSVGAFVAFGLYLSNLTWPLIALGWVTNLFQRGEASMARLNEIFDATPSVTTPSTPGALPPTTGGRAIEFRNVSFSYTGREVLHDISFTIPAGGTLGVVGATGSGKSALLELMARLYDPTSGTVLMDGIPLATLSLDALRAEAEEEAPVIVFTISDPAGRAIRQVTGPVAKGFNRVAWDLREPVATVSRGGAEAVSEEAGGRPQPQGNFAMPGVYKVQMASRVDGVLTPLGEPRSFRVVTDGANETEFKLLSEFLQKAAKLQKAVNAAVDGAETARTKIVALKAAAPLTPALAPKAAQDLRAVEQKLNAIRRNLSGDTFAAGRYEATASSISGRVSAIIFGARMSTQRPSGAWIEDYNVALRELEREVGKLRVILDTDLKALDKLFDAAGAPATPGRLPEFPLK